MNKIKQLSDIEARKIAAGEVVERPANVLKELLENSIDAGATKIDIYLEDAGKKLIRLVDNGCGMSKIDAELCFAHHATSKLTQVSDLQNLNTYGFRGEALSSISSVSRVILITRELESELGTKIELAAGDLVWQSSIGCTVGTDLAVYDLFYNIPARLKFLKKTETEWRQMLMLFQAFALTHTQVHFRLFSDHKLLYNCSAVELQDRLTQLWDTNLADQVLKLVTNINNPSNSNHNLQLAGLISVPQIERYNRNQLFLFVNKRWVRNIGLQKAIIKGYAGLLPEGRFPVGIVFIEVDSHELDINIHPRKEEVLFLHAHKIERLVYEAVKQTLEQYVTKKFNSQPSSASLTNVWANTQLNQNLNVNSLNFKPANLTSLELDITASSLVNNNKNFNSHGLLMATTWPSVNYTDSLQSKNQDNLQNLISPEQVNLEPDLNINHAGTISYQQQSLNLNQRQYKLLGQYQETYLLIEQVDGLLFVDQHAAHERILYEKFTQDFKQQNQVSIETINLLFPVVLNFTPADILILIECQDLLKTYGFLIEQFGEQQIVIQSTPVFFKNGDIKNLLAELLVAAHDINNLEKELFWQELNKLFKAQIACKSAVKSGDILTHEQMYSLLDELENVPNRLTCPHGRPTLWLLNLKDLEKKFKRDYR